MDYVEWVESFFESEPVTMRVSTGTAIRSMMAEHPGVYKTEKQALDDFLVVNWGYIVKGDK